MRELYESLVGEVLPSLRGLDETRRYLRLLAWLNTWLESRGLGRIVITGGFAVEVYTGRTYRTRDVDVIVEGAARLVEALLSRFSDRIGRGYLPRIEELELKSIDIVSTVYSKPAPPVKLVVDDTHVYLEPPEELVVTYLAAWRYWGAAEDRDKALWILAVWYDRLDMDYLRARARSEGVEAELEELLSLVRAELDGRRGGAR